MINIAPRTRSEKVPQELSAEEEIMVKISWLYYREGNTQQEIAKKLGLSRSKVGRILAKALALGIVEIKLSPKADLIHLSLEHELETRFHLKEALVVAAGEDPASLLENLGQAGGRLLDRLLPAKFTLGLGLGTSVASVLPYVTPRSESNSIVLTLSGGFTQPEHDTTGYDISWPLADTLGARLEKLYCPLVAASKEVKNAILSDPNLAAQLKRTQEVEVALISIGYPQVEMPLHRLGFCSIEDVNALLEAGAVGELIVTFYTLEGQPIYTDLYDRAIGVSLDTLQKIPFTVGIAGGLEKTEAILGALRIGCLDVLITDQVTAEAVLQLDQELPGS